MLVKSRAFNALLLMEISAQDSAMHFAKQGSMRTVEIYNDYHDMFCTSALEHHEFFRLYRWRPSPGVNAWIWCGHLLEPSVPGRALGREPSRAAH